jgi:predicted nucleic acid-binding protein
MARICVDACFLIGLYDADDPHHQTSVHFFNALFGEKSAHHQLVAPWPILYECLGSRYARSARKTYLFVQHWSYLNASGQLVLLDDGPYRETPLDEHLEERSRRGLSLVDRILRAMILNKARLFDFFLTYNTSDFMDACQIGAIPLMDQRASAESHGF